MSDTNNFMVGVAAALSALTDKDFSMMQEAGIGLLRTGEFSFDVDAFLRGDPQPERFREEARRVRRVREMGFDLVGLTPGPRQLANCTLTPGSAEYFEAYGRICEFFAKEFEDCIQWWQVANELDIWIFRDDLNLEQSVEFLKIGIRAMKAAVPTLKVGINITLYPSLPGEVDGNTEAHEGLVIAKGVYGDESLPVDYAGFDSYPGTWRDGGPESWHDYLDGFYELTGKPILIQEFGYSAAGELMNEDEVAQGLYPCEAKKWKFSWQGAHSPEVQADFIRESFKIFREKPYVLGAIYYKWRDSPRCWQCKEPDCPAETAWGVLDQDGKVRPAYEAFRESTSVLQMES